MRSTRICALYCALLISIMLASAQALGQARTSAPATAQSLPPALLDTPASSKPGPYLAQKRARILNLQAEEERLGNQSPELLPTIYDLADWYEHWGTVREARPLYRRAAAIIENAYGSDDLRLVQPLRQIASSYEREGKFRSEGRNALQRIEHLYAANDSAAEQ